MRTRMKEVDEVVLALELEREVQMVQIHDSRREDPYINRRADKVLVKYSATAFSTGKLPQLSLASRY